MKLTPSKHKRKVTRDYNRIMHYYNTMRNDYPEASDTSIFEAIANRLGWTRVGIMRVVKRQMAKETKAS